MDDTPDVVRFEPWPSRFDGIASVTGPYARFGWLPTIGPSSYLIWETVAEQLKRAPDAEWPIDELATAHGLGGTGNTSPVRRSLRRLELFKLAHTRDDGTVAILTWAPPLIGRQIARLPDRLVRPVDELHRRNFIAPAEVQPG